MTRTPPPGTMLNVIARSPFNVYFEGKAEVLSATNRIGQFDILPGHADFFSVLEPGNVMVTVKDGEEPVVFSIKNGILTVRDDEVYLFADV